MEVGWPWTYVRRTERIQGWKLHVSAVPRNAARVLATAATLLERSRTPYKFASTEAVLQALNEGELGATQIGKFLTIYPETTEEAGRLARALAAATATEDGPDVPSDFPLGGRVFARYGGFNPIIKRDRLGQFIRYIHGPSHQLVLDRYEIPPVLQGGVEWPFHHCNPLEPSPPGGSPTLFGPGYLVLEILSEHPKGSTFRAIDLRSQDLVRAVVIKQGRRHCVEDILGRDMPARLRRQQEIHQALRGRVPIAEAIDCFEEQGTTYLVLENLEGENLERWVGSRLVTRPFNRLPQEERKRILHILRDLARAIGQLHAAGYAHRDLTASNVHLGDDGVVRLLDLELAHRPSDSEPALYMGTPGFVSPQQELRHAPQFADDVFSLGCVALFATTGMDPRRIRTTDGVTPERWCALAPGVPVKVATVISRALREEVGQRPSVAEIEGALEESLSANSARPARRQSPRSVESALIAGRDALLTCSPTTAEGLWLSASLEGHGSNRARNTAPALELRMSANRGVAGVVYVLSRLERYGFGTEILRARVRTATAWLCSGPNTPDSGMPGLHFGTAGVGLALAEACGAGIVEPDRVLRDAVSRMLDGPLDWPDLTHGAAGQALAVIGCRNVIGDQRSRAALPKITNHLIETQSTDGSWELPAGVDGLTGATLTGMAHGVAGIAFGLLQAAKELNDPGVHSAAVRGIDWLTAAGRAGGQTGSLDWSYSTTQAERWHWWCHGGPGIALLYLRAFEITGDASYALMARQALLAHTPKPRAQNLSQCHGLSGLGEIYLEAARVLGERRWLERARYIGDLLVACGLARDSGGSEWCVEHPSLRTADLMVGSSGVIHFLLRLAMYPSLPGFPLLPVEPVS